jgi:hypothetical protein
VLRDFFQAPRSAALAMEQDDLRARDGRETNGLLG